MKAPRVGFIIILYSQCGVYGELERFYFQILCTGIDFLFLNDEILFQFTRNGFVYCASCLLAVKGKRCGWYKAGGLISPDSYVVELLSFNPLGIFSYGTFGRQIGILQTCTDSPMPAYGFTERKRKTDGEIIMVYSVMGRPVLSFAICSRAP